MVGCGLASRRVTYRTQWFPLLEEHRRREVDFVLQGGASATVAHLRVNKACQGEGAGTQERASRCRESSTRGMAARMPARAEFEGLPRDLTSDLTLHWRFSMILQQAPEGRIKHHIF